MTSRERRLRERIDTLIDERDALRRPRKRHRHCVYCAARTNTTRRVAVCASHADLLAVDPHYSEAVAA